MKMRRVDDGGEVVRRKFAEVPRSRSIAIGGPEWQVGWRARATQNFEPAEHVQLHPRHLHTTPASPPPTLVKRGRSLHIPTSACAGHHCDAEKSIPTSR
jgi:hypothetical protein